MTYRKTENLNSFVDVFVDSLLSKAAAALVEDNVGFS